MSAIADAPEVPVLFHCHAGKDRTGMIAALLLSLANVPDEIVAQDYSLTYTYLRDQFEQWKAGLTTTDPHVRARLIEGFRCRPETMLQVLDHLQRRYGGVEGYLLSLGLGRDQIERLRRRLVP
jgi:protein tyrosine/serine phosphatase